jgi:hypothetical protein
MSTGPCGALKLQADTVWVNDWAVLDNRFEEGGYQGSGQGRMRGSRAQPCSRRSSAGLHPLGQAQQAAGDVVGAEDAVLAGHFATPAAATCPISVAKGMSRAA